jgi:uncharacterized protein (DUF433 family)
MAPLLQAESEEISPAVTIRSRLDVAMNAPAQSLGLGLFPLPEAARLAQLDTRTARRWAEGYPFTHEGEKRFSRGVMPLALTPSGGQRDLTFAEMLTLRLVKAFKGAGLGVPTIKRVAERAASDFGMDMPFVSKRFRTDGRKVFVELQTQPPANDEPGITRHERELIEVLTGQHQFADLVEPSLFANVDWQDDLASRWWPLGKACAVNLDPTIVFGAPHVAGTRVPTRVIAEAVKAEGGGKTSVEAVAEWYGLRPQQVQDAIRFETEWFKRVA